MAILSRRTKSNYTAVRQYYTLATAANQYRPWSRPSDLRTATQQSTMFKAQKLTFFEARPMPEVRRLPNGDMCALQQTEACSITSSAKLLCVKRNADARARRRGLPNSKVP